MILVDHNLLGPTLLLGALVKSVDLEKKYLMKFEMQMNQLLHYLLNKLWTIDRSSFFI